MLLYIQTLFSIAIGQIPSNRHVLRHQRPIIYILDQTSIQKRQKNYWTLMM